MAGPCDTLQYPLGDLKNLKRDEKMEKLRPSTLLVGLLNGAATVGNSLAVPQKFQHSITIRSSNFTPRYTLPKRNENIGPQKNWYTRVHRALFTIAKRCKQPE